MKQFAICWLAALLLLTGCKKELSGSYLADNESSICWLQLVRTPDEHLTGQLVTSVLKPDGKIERRSVSLTGARNGANITLNTAGLLGLGSATLSGTIEGDTLTLLGAQSKPISFKRASLENYQAKITAQSADSQAIITAVAAAKTREHTLKMQKDFVTGVSQIIGRMQRFETEADVHLGKFPSAEKGLADITTRVSVFVTRERQLAGNPNRSVDRSQLGVAATQASLTTDQIFYQIQALRAALAVNIAPLEAEVTRLEAGCHESHEVRAEALERACNSLVSASPAFHQRFATMIAGLDHLEAVYKKEKSAQTKLLNEAQSLE